MRNSSIFLIAFLCIFSLAVSSLFVLPSFNDEVTDIKVFVTVEKPILGTPSFSEYSAERTTPRILNIDDLALGDISVLSALSDVAQSGEITVKASVGTNSKTVSVGKVIRTTSEDVTIKLRDVPVTSPMIVQIELFEDSQSITTKEITLQ